MPWVILGIAVAILAIALIGYPRHHIPREAHHHEEFAEAGMAPMYNRVSRRPGLSLVRWMMVRELKKCQPGAFLVDIGCGPGHLLASLSQKYPGLKVIGLDIDDGMLHFARENLADPADSKIELCRGDVHRLPFKDNSVDFMVSTLTLHHLADAGQSLGEIYRALKPGGGFLFLDFRRDCRRFFYQLFKFDQAFRLPRDAHHGIAGAFRAAYTPTETRAILAQTPFSKWQIKPGMGLMFVSGSK